MIEFGYKTDVGKVREHNEDNLRSLPEKGLWLIADGMGGNEAGEVASALVIETVPNLLNQGLGLKEALLQTHYRVHRAVKDGLGERGMGSTAVALQLNAESYEIAWVGDSRAYLWNGSSLIRLTRDHSLVQQLLDSGKISQEEAEKHPQRNVITQALGAAMKEVRVDTVKGHLAKGDRILLCSDGLNSELSDYEIAVILSRETSCQELSDRLVEAAIAKRGSDNISVVLVNAPEDAPIRNRKSQTPQWKAIEGNRDQAGQKREKKSKVYGVAGALLAIYLIFLYLLFLHLSAPMPEPLEGKNIPAPPSNETKPEGTPRIQIHSLKTVNGLGQNQTQPSASINQPGPEKEVSGIKKLSNNPGQQDEKENFAKSPPAQGSVQPTNSPASKPDQKPEATNPVKKHDIRKDKSSQNITTKHEKIHSASVMLPSKEVNGICFSIYYKKNSINWA
jgi:protein phosphatase